jgi:hypothetical protein
LIVSQLERFRIDNGVVLNCESIHWRIQITKRERTARKHVSWLRVHLNQAITSVTASLMSHTLFSLNVLCMALNAEECACNMQRGDIFLAETALQQQKQLRNCT